MGRDYWRFVFTCVLGFLNLPLTSATPCGVLTATTEKKLLTSEGYPIKYEPSQTCSWSLQASNASKNVILETVDMMIQPSTACVDDSVSIYDGDSNSSTKLHTLCGDSRVFLTSSGRNMYLEFRSNSILETRGFQFRYYQGDKATPCTFTFTATGDVKTFNSPGYPIAYFNDVSCEYSIQAADASDILQLRFTDVDVQSSQTCRYDNISVANIISGGDDPVATICGMPTSSYQGRNKMKVTFTSDGSKVNKGFSVKYRSVPKEECSIHAQATDMDAFILSPVYPTQNYSNLNCRWTIVATNNDATVELAAVFSDIADTSPSCSSDRVSVTDSDMTELGTFCGTNKPTYNSTGPNMTVVFTTDGTNQATGFRLKYKQKRAAPATCGGTLTASSPEELLSPGYPRAYLRSWTCTWTITAYNESFVNLKLVDIDVEVSDQCQPDSLKIYDGGNSASPLLGTWCGQMNGYRLQSTGNVMTLVFNTDDSNNGRGFNVSYKQDSTRMGCIDSFEATDTYSYITSPNYPNSFPGVSSCTSYKITPDLDTRIKLEVLELNLPERVSGECTSDYITVHDGWFNTSIPLKSINTQNFRFCGKELPTFVSPRFLMFVQFHSTQATTTSSFRMRYLKGIFADEFVSPCGGSLIATDEVQNITSPSYPNNYTGFLNCSWTITATDSTKMVRLITTDFQLLDRPYPNSCGLTYLRIYDGDDNDSNYVDECSKQALMQHQSTKNKMTVVLEAFNKANAFSLQYTQTADRLSCDHIKDIGNYGSIKFPGSVEGPVQGRFCSWLLRRTSMEDDRYLELTINSTALIQSPNCTKDYIRVYDGQSSSSPLIGRFCGGKVSELSFFGNNVFITSALSSQGSFEIDYSPGFTSFLGRDEYLYSDRKSILTSPNYPLNYPRNAEFSWTLNAYGEKIVVEVMSSQIEMSEGCVNDRAEAYDGASKKDKLLGKWCGTETPSFESSGGKLTIVLFSNDNEIAGKGFQIKYYEKESYLGYIIGGVVGGVLVILVIGAAVFISVKRPFKSRNNNANVQAKYVNKH
ncbi:cubilin-like isoform X1 [Haliotis rufescens]|uniref:cubilin-like isoform X1 n=2 Tax=Haliotis rufescens TaxID=6454 RepID=UPI00201FA6A6|nr:cubilin-like isoform X1 [Haliotis rufescens]